MREERREREEENGFTYSELAEESCTSPCVYRAEVLAAEIRELQGEMADYNTVRLRDVERCLYELHS